jgi:hypothetical protein
MIFYATGGPVSTSQTKLSHMHHAVVARGAAQLPA